MNACLAGTGRAGISTLLVTHDAFEAGLMRTMVATMGATRVLTASDPQRMLAILRREVWRIDALIVDTGNQAWTTTGLPDCAVRHGVTSLLIADAGVSAASACEIELRLWVHQTVGPLNFCTVLQFMKQAISRKRAQMADDANASRMTGLVRPTTAGLTHL